MRWFFAFTLFLNGFFFLWQNLQSNSTATTIQINSAITRSDLIPIQLLSERPDLKQKMVTSANHQTETATEQPKQPY